MSFGNVPRHRIPSNKRFSKEIDEYFRPHRCTLDSLHYMYGIRCGQVRWFLFDLATINFNDVRARSMFNPIEEQWDKEKKITVDPQWVHNCGTTVKRGLKSYASLSAERYRHFTEHPLAIHPFSKLAIWTQVVVFICVLIGKYLMPFWISQTRPSDADLLHRIIHVFQVIYMLINIPVNALSGYIEGKNSQNIVLDKWKILKHYLYTWMVVDATALLCAIYEFVPHNTYSHTHLIPLIASITEVQWIVLFCYANNICTVFRIGMCSRTILKSVLYVTAYLSWNIVIQFALEYYMEGGYHPAQPRACSWLTIGQLWDEPGEVRLIYSLYRAVGMLRKNSNLNLLQYDGCFEIFTIISFIVAQMYAGFLTMFSFTEKLTCLILHCSFKCMLALFGTQSAKMKYYIMSQQIQTYMNHRRFPPRIKKKILKFYAIRFRSHFFVESIMLDCVSGQLHEDIIMHSGRQLVREVTFLKQLPWSVLIDISLKFELTIFIEGDIIYKIHTIGDRMFFIHKGTIALYSESGCELAHMDDGEHFGETSLITKHVRRLVTAVAVTNCELFSLSRENFAIVEKYLTAYDDLRKTAVIRVQWIKMMDDQYKTQLKDWRESK